MTNFDGEAFYEKYIRDIMDTQLRMHNVQWHTNGAIPDCVPLVWPCHATGDPGWSFALFAMAEGFFSHYSPQPAYQALLLSSLSWAADFWVGAVEGNKGVFPYAFYGDWSQYWPGNITSDVRTPDYGNYYYTRALGITADFAGRVGTPAQAAHYAAAYAKARGDYLTLFYNSTTGCFSPDCNYVSNIFALDLGILPPGSSEEWTLWGHVQSAINGYAAGPYLGHFGGGITSTRLLYPLLERFGAVELGLSAQLQPTPPSLASFLVSGGGTTLFEQYNLSAGWTLNGASFNHAMFGGSGFWYYTTLAGLRQAGGGNAQGWSNLSLVPPYSLSTPDSSHLLTSASASINTSSGFVASSWACCMGTPPSGPSLYFYNASVPVGGVATLLLPTVSPPSSISLLESTAGVVWTGTGGGVFTPSPGIFKAAPSAAQNSLVLSLGSGDFHFTVVKEDT